jgi:hypothetical protein
MLISRKKEVSLLLVAHVCNLSYLEAEIGRITAQDNPWKVVQETSIPKIFRAKWTGSIAQAVECLLCKCEAPSSNPSPAKKKKSYL